MAFISSQVSGPERPVDWVRLMHDVGPRFAERAASYDAKDAFVTDNFIELKGRNVFVAGAPRELGGGGASYRELCDMLRVLARHCGSTALALSMHTHALATMTWRWRRDPKAVHDLLRRVVKDGLVLVVSGASDWINSSGTARRVDGGWRINARKLFASGSPFGDVLVTQAVADDPETGPVVLHFPVPLRGSGVEIQDTWRVLGMRGTGSHDIVLTDVFVPESEIFLRRPVGQWTPTFQLFACILPLPLVFAVYVGIAEAARDTALALARGRSNDPDLPPLVGEMENELAVARLAQRDMVEAAETCEEPGLEITNRIMTGRTLVGRATTRVLEKAMAVVGGRSFYRSASLERMFRDVQGARFHRPQEQNQLHGSGCLALGIAPDR